MRLLMRILINNLVTRSTVDLLIVVTIIKFILALQHLLLLLLLLSVCPHGSLALVV